MLTSNGQRRLSSESIELMEKYLDLPHPATYVCHSNLDFPCAETILPVVKRNLMKEPFPGNRPGTGGVNVRTARRGPGALSPPTCTDRPRC